MSPRKRLRRNPAASVTSLDVSTPVATSQASSASRGSDASADSAMAGSPASSAVPSVSESLSDARRYASFRQSKNKNRSWYGSWPRAPKSAASTQLARETILGGTLKPRATPDFSRFDTRKPGDISDDSGADETPTLRQTTVPLPAADRTANEEQEETPVSPPEGSTPTRGDGTTQSDPVPNGVDGPPNTKDMGTTQELTSSPELSTKEPTPPAAGWFSWLGRSAPDEGKQQEEESATPRELEAGKEEETRLPPPEPKNASHSTPAHDADRPTTSASMLSYFWSSAPKATPATAQTATEQGNGSALSSNPTEPEPQDVVMKDAPSAPIPVPKSSSSTPGASAPASASAGTTWAFWSRDTRPKTTGKPLDSPEQGEMAVIGERSEAHPKPAIGVEVNGSSTKPSSKPSSVKEVPAKEAPSRDTLPKKAKRLRPSSLETDDVPPAPPVVSKSDVSAKGEGSSSKQAASSKLQQTQLKTPPPNLLFPSFLNTYRLKENPSILRQIGQFLMRTQQPPANHVFLTKDLPKVHKAVAIGVHGLFPAAYLRPMIGQPTGTSIRFVNHAAEAVRRWADRHGYQDCEIEKIALEGEGKIADRVENLWKLLLNWIDHVRSADLIILACHSQGVPVGVMLLAKLIDLGIITTARIGVCAMAGVSLGPFPDYKSGLGILMGSAGELWDFGNPESEVSKRYAQSLKTVLEYGVRITFIGSIDDQVVPLESAMYSPVYHPYVYRAVFVDGRVHTPDFIAHLVGFACKLRNLGVSDHGLLRELSVPLAGSLYSGEGHSRLYDDPQVYDLALSHALETADVGNVACDIRKYEGLSSPNPYHLPWIMRGLLEEDFVKTDLHIETVKLLEEFDDWKPATKALKDVKYRLEAVRSKL